MNYYLQWWENARNNTGIWTKKTYQDYLEKRIKDLESGVNGQAFLELEAEKEKLKEKLTKSKQEIKESDGLIADFAKENEAKDLAKNEAETNLLKVQQEFQTLTNLANKRIKEIRTEYEKDLAEAQTGKANLLKDNLFKETLIKELKVKGEKELTQLITEKADLVRELEEVEVAITNFCQKHKVNNLVQLEKKLNSYLQTTNNQLVKIERLETQLTEQEQKSQQAQILFNSSILEIIKKNTTLILWKGKDMKLAISQLQELMNWDKIVLPDMGSSTSLPLDKEKAQLVKEIEKLNQEKAEKDQEIRALKLDKTELLRKLASTPISRPATPLFPEPRKLTKKELQWQNISLEFTTELIKVWEKHKFTYEQTQEWISIGLSVDHADFANWLVKVKKGNYAKPDWCLNHGNLNELKEEFENYKK